MRSPQGLPRPLGLGQRVHRRDAEALRDGARIQAARGLRGHHVDDAGGAGRLAEDGDAIGVAAECRDVAANPAERGGHVEQAVVAAGVLRRLCAERRVGHEAERSEPIVEGDEQHAVPRQVAVHEHRVAASALLERAAVKPDQDRPARIGRRCRAPDVEVEAVFAHRLHAGVLGVDRARGPARLQALRRERARRTYPAPALDRPRAAASAAGRAAVPRTARRGRRERRSADRPRRRCARRRSQRRPRRRPCAPGRVRRLHLGSCEARPARAAHGYVVGSPRRDGGCQGLHACLLLRPSARTLPRMY